MALLQIFGLVKLHEGNFDTVQEAIVDQPYLDPIKAAEIVMEARQNNRLFIRLNDPQNPYIIKDGPRRKNIQMWMDPDYDDASYAVALWESVTVAGDDIDIVPEMLMRGSQAQFALFYQMSCCTGMSAVACFNQGDMRKIACVDSLTGMVKGYETMFNPHTVVVATAHQEQTVLSHMRQHVVPALRDQHACKPDSLRSFTMGGIKDTSGPGF